MLDCADIPHTLSAFLYSVATCETILLRELLFLSSWAGWPLTLVHPLCSFSLPVQSGYCPAFVISRLAGPCSCDCYCQDLCHSQVPLCLPPTDGTSLGVWCSTASKVAYRVFRISKCCHTLNLCLQPQTPVLNASWGSAPRL